MPADTIGDLLVGIGAVIAALASAGWSVASKRQAKKATAAYEASPTAVIGSLRAEVKALIDASAEAAERHAEERKALEAAIRQQRKRADVAEAANAVLRGDIVALKIDLAAAQAQISELKTTLDAVVNGGSRP